MTALKNLRFFLRDALAPYTEDIAIVSTTNPIEVSMNGKKYSIYVLSVTDSGETRPNPDEQRIQITRSARESQKKRRREGFAPLFVGFYPDGKVFTAWEPAYPFSLRAKNGSVYARLSHHDVALQLGGAVYRLKPKYLTRKTSTLSLPAEQLGFYLENCGTLHSAVDDDQLVAALDATSDALGSGKSSARVKLGRTRKRVTVTRTAYARSPDFTRNVLAAYDYACCVCRKQLRLVQAAHIIPHSHDDSSDEVGNGLALCIEHHRLYDDGLLLIQPDGMIQISPDRVEHLENIGQDEGIKIVKKFDGKRIRMPADGANRPLDDLLARGVRIRLETGT
jgi:putative restriction endonuclease